MGVGVRGRGFRPEHDYQWKIVLRCYDYDNKYKKYMGITLSISSHNIFGHYLLKCILFKYELMFKIYKINYVVTNGAVNVE